MAKELKYNTNNLFDIQCLVEDWKSEINKLNTDKKVIDGKIELLYENIARVENHIDSIKKQNEEQK